MALDVDNAKGELVIDPHRFKERYLSWDKTIPRVTKQNEAAIVNYMEDMRQGRNINPKAVRGRRGYSRIMTQRLRLARIARLLEADEGIVDMAASAPDEIRRLEAAVARVFSNLEDGRTRRKDGKRYLATNDYLKGFKAFWHWHMVRMKRERDLLLPDITEYLVVSRSRKPSFVYFGIPGKMDVEEGFRRLFDQAAPRYRPLLAFMFDSGARSPTETSNIKRKDFTDIPGTRYFNLTIRDETSKTFGRTIKLMLCHEHLRSYFQAQQFQPEDFVFSICPRVVNQYLRRLGERVLQKQGLSMYDFRHNAVCYFLPRYKNENALMYRFGWKDSAMIHYYSEYLGMKDTLQDDDFLVDLPKRQVEKELESERRGRMELDDELQRMRQRMEGINALMNQLTADPETLDFLTKKVEQLKIARGAARPGALPLPTAPP